ncbi:hypothetical protein ABPG73_001441 [Tetrahymena malaccensis]
MESIFQLIQILNWRQELFPSGLKNFQKYCKSLEETLWFHLIFDNFLSVWQSNSECRATINHSVAHDKSSSPERLASNLQSKIFQEFTISTQMIQAKNNSLELSFL